jgi:hypothetical protein
MNRTNHDCFGVASSGSGGLSERSGWDLGQPAELYVESLAPSRNPFLVHADEFLRMNFYGLGQVRAERGIDPIESSD